MLKPKAVKAAKLASSVALTAALACMTPAVAFATPGEDAQAQANAALAQLDTLSTQLDQAERDYATAMEATDEAKANVASAQGRIDEANVRIGELQGQLGSRARSMYRSGSMSILDLLFGATSFQEFATNWNLLERMNQADADLVSETKYLRAQVEEEKVYLEEQEVLAVQHQAEAQAVVESATAAQAEMQATYSSLSEEASRLLAEEQAAREAAEAAAAQATVEAAAAAAAAEQAAAANDSSSSSSDDSGSNSSSAPQPSYDAATGNAVVDRALSWVGRAEYVWGACSPGAFDCSGFVSYCLTGAYSRLGTTYTFLGWPQVSDPQPGDVCVNEGHCGIYYGGGQMIHSSTYGVGVIIGPVQSGMIIVRY
ncbi:MAG: NlpC/P60 family protein [Coriobacteriia bacterium]|nr:NlpC/P60 family protein [Coriobacteriia bacterium]